jgi:hypothetical protein
LRVDGLRPAGIRSSTSAGNPRISLSSIWFRVKRFLPRVPDFEICFLPRVFDFEHWISGFEFRVSRFAFQASGLGFPGG